MSAPESLTRHTILSAAAPETFWLRNALSTHNAEASVLSFEATPISVRALFDLPARETTLPTLQAVKRRYEDEDADDDDDDDLDGFGEEEELDDFDDDLDDLDDDGELDDLDDDDDLDFDDDFEEEELEDQLALPMQVW